MKNCLKKKVYTLNFWYGYNYGATLTAYALYQILKRINYEPVLIDNMSSIERIRYKNFFSIKFIKKYCKISKSFNKLSNIEEINNMAQAFIVGSDQVFRTKHIEKNNTIWHYCLDFAKEDIKKIAFSASFGVEKENFLTETSITTINKMKKSFKSFDFISVREKSGTKICRDIFRTEAKWIIDPVFMLDKEEYANLINDAKGNYEGKIISYTFNRTKEFQNNLKILSQKYNSKIFELDSSFVSIEDWLCAIKNAKLVVTNSFHGVCFSIIFNKPFICIINPEADKSRFSSIFKMLNIEDKSLNDCSKITNHDYIFSPNYNEVNSLIFKEKEKGINYLKEVLSSNVNFLSEKKDIRIDFLKNKALELEKEATISCILNKNIWQYLLCIYYRLPKFVQTIIKRIRNKHG